MPSPRPKFKQWIKSLPQYWREGIVILLILYMIVRLIALSSIPAATSSLLFGTPTPTTAPTSTPVPPPGSVYLKFATEGIAQVESFSGATFIVGGVPAQLVIVLKRTVITENGNEITRHVSEEFCVGMAAYLDKDDLRLPDYDKEKAKSVLIILKTKDLARYSEVIPDKVQVYLVRDAACVK